MPTRSTETPDKQPAAETLEEITHNIVELIYGGAQYPSRLTAYSRILSALRNERERAAKIAQDTGTIFYRERQKTHSPYDPKDLIFAQDVCDKIAKAIRGEESDLT